MADTREYVLGTNRTELERLEFQHSVWRDLTNDALRRAGIAPGQRVLDLGCGPGFVAREIASILGPTGSLVALDEAPVWHDVLRTVDFACPTELIESKIEDADLGEAEFDIIFSRWVFSFLGDLDAPAAKVFRALRSGGRLVVQDYNHEGISLFPPSAGFDAAVRATRAFYAGSGGDAWVQGTLPGALRRAGFGNITLQPNVRCGGPDSPVFQWADVFFPIFSKTYVERGLMTAEERDSFLADWDERKRDPDALFYSPMIVDIVAERP